MIDRWEASAVDKTKRRTLEAGGWKVGDTQEFLGLTDEDIALIDIKIALSQLIRQLRRQKKLTQEQTARLIGSSQSRVAKIEAGDPSVSIDLQVKSLIKMGATKEEVGEVISRGAA
jgi:DNA-binding XRE family transcriptional regulator